MPKKKTVFDQLDDPDKNQAKPVIKAKGACKVNTIEEALELGGGFGRFQRYQVVICCLCMMRCGLQYYPLPFLELAPDYECEVGGAWESCTADKFCGDPSV